MKSRKLVSLIIVSSVISSSLPLSALEFGKMGNRAPSMGGAGVALTGQRFAAFYNPALIGSENTVGIGYTTGLTFQQENIDSIIKYAQNFKGLIPSQAQNFDKNRAVSLYRTLKNLDNILTKNYLRISSHSGLSAEFSPPFVRGTVGSFGLGYFLNISAGASVNIGQVSNDIIIKTSDNQYTKLTQNGGTETSSDAAYKATALGKIAEGSGTNQFKLRVTRSILTEVPLSYSHTFYLPGSILSIGASGKFMKLTLDNKEESFDKLGNVSFLKSLTDLKNIQSKSNFTADVGAVLSLDLVSITGISAGFVAKNITSPKFKFDKDEIKVAPQYRAGIALNKSIVSASFDVDVVPNEVLNFSSKKTLSQVVGGGASIDLGIIDMRLGGLYDVRQDTGLVVTAGLGVFGLIDLGVQVSTSRSKTSAFKPRLVNAQLEGGFSF